MEMFDAVLMEANVTRMTFHTSEWSLFQRALLPSLLWLFGEFLLGVAFAETRRQQLEH